MNKKMREILAAIEAKTKEMRGFPRHQRHRESQGGCGTEIEGPLKEQYELEEKCFKAEQSRVEEPAPAEKELTAAEKDVKAFAGYVRAMVEKTSTPPEHHYGQQRRNHPPDHRKPDYRKGQGTLPHLRQGHYLPQQGHSENPLCTVTRPLMGETAHNITVGLHRVFRADLPTLARFCILTGYLVGALTLIGKS